MTKFKGVAIEDIRAGSQVELDPTNGQVSLTGSVGTPRFDYKVEEVLSVHDGDTFTCRLDLGLDVKRVVIIRLARINAPELATPDGPEWQTHLESWLRVHGARSGRVRATTLRMDNWHRWVSEVYERDYNFSDWALKNGCPAYVAEVEA